MCNKLKQWSLLLFVYHFSFVVSAGEQASLVEAGKYLIHAAGCISCHTDQENKGEYLAGGRQLKTPFGTFYTPNITADPVYGIGGWSDDDLIQALREGVSPDGSHYYPVFPYTSYTKLTEADIRVMAAYLRTVKPSSIKNRDHDLPWYLFRWVMAIWKWLFFQSGQYENDPNRDETYNRGAYLVAIGHCSECHSPRDNKGVPISELYLAGTKNGPEDEVIPNITPDVNTGIGKWSEQEISNYLKTGELPDGDYSGSLMAEVIDDGTRYLLDKDLRSIAIYLRDQKPIINTDFKSKKKKQEDEW